MSGHIPISRIAYKDLALDPLLSKPGNQFAGLYVRIAADVFRFVPIPRCATSPVITIPAPHDPAPVAIQAIDASRWKHGLHVKFEDDDQSQELFLPPLGNQHDVRFAWSVSLSSTKRNHLATFSLASPLVRLLDSVSKNESLIDLQSSPKKIKISVGDGFVIGTFGDTYPFLALVRLVACSPSVFEIILQFHNKELEVHCESSVAMNAHFIVLLVPQRTLKSIGGTPSAAIRPAEIAIVISQPHSPRVLLNLASMSLSFADRPVSRRPMSGHPRSSFPIMPIAGENQTIWPARSNIQGAELVRALRGVVFIGDVSAKQLAEVLQKNSFARFVGIITASFETALQALPLECRNRVNLSIDEACFFTHNTSTIGLLVVPNIVAGWGKIEEFVAIALERGNELQLPERLTDARDEQISCRLPALPFCLDLQVAIVLAVGNRQRGRAMLDRGSDELDYELFSDNDLWLVPWEAERVNDRDDLILEINLRLVAEYLATVAYADLIKTTKSSTANFPADVPVLKEMAGKYVEVWEIYEDLDLIKAVREDLLYAMQLHDIPGTLTLPLLAAAFLTRFRKRLDIRGYTDRLRRINPLMVVLATGGSGPFDLPLELASAYWSSYVASFSSAKPGAMLATFVERKQMFEPLRRERHLRETIRALNSTDEQQRLRLRIKRQSLGDSVSRMMSPAFIKLLYAADTDRIIACAPVTLDFIPFAGTILGLERPMSRMPAGEELGAAFHIVNAAALSSSSDMIGSGRAVILAPFIPRDACERAAVEFRDKLASVLPYSGFVTEILPQQATVDDTLFEIELSELVIFAGHAWTGVDSSGIDLQRFVLTGNELEKIRWAGKLVMLVGCETAAVGSGNHDIAETLLRCGARAVVGTTSEVDATQGLHFVTTLLRYALSGEPIDYAFFAARREITVAEGLLSTGVMWDDAVGIAEQICHEDITSDFNSMITRAGLNWDQVFSAAVFSLSWTLFGGASERLR